MEKLLQSHQFHRLLDPGIAHHQKVLVLDLAVLGQLDQRAKTRGIDEVDMGQVDQQRFAVLAMGAKKFNKFFVGIGVQLAGETEQLALGLLLKATTQGNRQSLQVVNSSSLQIRSGTNCRAEKWGCRGRTRSAPSLHQSS